MIAISETAVFPDQHPCISGYPLNTRLNCLFHLIHNKSLYMWVDVFAYAT